MTHKEKIIEFMKDKAYKPLLIDELRVVLDVPREDYGDFITTIDELEAEGRIVKTKKGRYGVAEKMGIIAGTFQGNEKGFGFVIPDNDSINDIFVTLRDSKGAMNKDKVLVKLTTPVIGTRKAEGEVVRIIERANKVIVGIFEKSNPGFGFVVPDDKRIFYDIFISGDDLNNAKNGQVVVAQILKWPEGRRNPEGQIIQVLGSKENADTYIYSIIKQYGLNEEFPNKVVQELDAIPDAVDLNDIKSRRDLRDLTIVTIDGEDAKDLDDAVSIEKMKNGNYKLGVHIADVSNYVKENSKIDKEAFKRGTSVYLVDRVIPMLPRKLSNGICSLNPKVDRLTLSVFMEIDNLGEVVDYEICESVIRTSERMTYKDVTAILEEKDDKVIEKYEYLVDTFKLMEELALILRKKRFERGSIDFDFPEPKIILDENNKPVEVKKYEITISNKIIEEFMLVCNETVAEYMFWMETPFIYRIHEKPDVEKIEKFNSFIFNFGYHIKGASSNIHPKTLQQIIEKIKGQKEERIISTLMLRSLMKAKYSEDNAGHFGLAAKYYCHFTSPIRRYPDLAIHRIIKEHINKKITSERKNYLKDFVREAAKQASEREIAAQEAERETDDLKKAEFMQNKIGNVYDGVISGVISKGMFVELENTIEGFVSVSSMEDDYYNFDEVHYCLMGEHTNRIYKIGDEVKVKLVRADVPSRQIDFNLFKDDSE